MTMTLGAHEVLELHEVLNDAIHGLNTLRLYRPYAKDPQLQAMMDQHMNALNMEYNNLIQHITHERASQVISERHFAKNRGFHPTYGLRDPQTQTPASSTDDIDDMDVTTCLISCHKQTAGLKMKAALEMANPTLRRAIQHGANMSADMAYQAFQYANHKGYYQVPTFKDKTQENFMQSYGSAPMTQMNMPGNTMGNTIM
ncbi:MAG TPA: spore coat protein [Chondromyces sp.]|nr:spore coat protein [Chondromyces sp.]